MTTYDGKDNSVNLAGEMTSLHSILATFVGTLVKERDFGCCCLWLLSLLVDTGYHLLR